MYRIHNHYLKFVAHYKYINIFCACNSHYQIIMIDDSQLYIEIDKRKKSRLFKPINYKETINTDYKFIIMSIMTISNTEMNSNFFLVNVCIG